jgi:RimJ/RimL family protein N-acetyltransferase
VIPAPSTRVRFRLMSANDLDNMADLLGDPIVMRFYPEPKSRSGALAWIEWNEKNYYEHGYGLWIIETRDGDFIGDCGLTWQLVNGVYELEVGYHVRTAAQGRGYATEAAAACRDFARDHTSATRLVAIIHPENAASKRVAEKIGMHQAEDDEGHGTLVRTVMRMPLRTPDRDPLTLPG